MARQYATLTREIPTSWANGKWNHVTSIEAVEVLARNGVWAMVKFPRAVPFVVPLKELSNFRKYQKPLSDRTKECHP